MSQLTLVSEALGAVQDVPIQAMVPGLPLARGWCSQRRPSMQLCCLLRSMLMQASRQPSPPLPGVCTQPMVRNLFLGEKGQRKGSGCLTPAGALEGASVSHRCSGAAAPPYFHHTPLVTASCPNHSGSASPKRHMKGHRDIDTRHVPEIAMTCKYGLGIHVEACGCRNPSIK